MGIFVLMNAAHITTNKGIAANRVNKPNNKTVPQIISNAPVKFAQNTGSAKPIFAKRPAPTVSGVINFCNPSERKIKPTIRRGISDGVDDVLKILFFIL